MNAPLSDSRWCSGPTEADAGDSVMVSPDGSANIVYADGCKSIVQPGAVMTIAPLSPCASGSNAQDSNDRNNTGAYIIGAAAIAVGLGIYGIIEASHNGAAPGPNPASP